MNDDNIAIRLKFLIEKLGINSSQFADTCKIPRPTFSQILNGRNKKISDQIIRQIHEAYPKVSISWLLFNEGDIWKDKGAASSGSISLGTENDLSGTTKSNNMDDSNLEFPFEDSKFVDDDTSIVKNGNLTGVNPTGNTNEHSIKEEVRSLLKSTEILNEIAKKTSKCRKVVSVTIYYDDSTFETFRPA